MNLPSVNTLMLVLEIPAGAAMILALLPSYRLSSRINVLASFLTLLSALSLFANHPEPDSYFLVDDLNIVSSS
jgi:hydrogenase-4 component F